MAEVEPARVVDDVATLKAVADPIRLGVVELTMADPARTWTAKELAGAAGVPLTKIYYHLKLLEQHGLLRIRDTRVVNGIIEKQYGAGQRDLTFHRAGAAAEGAGDGVRGVAVNLLQQARDEITRGLAGGWMSAAPEAPERGRMLLSRAVAEIPESRLGEFRAELLAMVRRFEDSGAPGGHRFTLMVALHPTDAPVPSGTGPAREAKAG